MPLHYGRFSAGSSASPPANRHGTHNSDSSAPRCRKDRSSTSCVTTADATNSKACSADTEETSSRSHLHETCHGEQTAAADRSQVVEVPTEHHVMIEAPHERAAAILDAIATN